MIRVRGSVTRTKTRRAPPAAAGTAQESPSPEGRQRRQKSTHVAQTDDQVSKGSASASIARRSLPPHPTAARPQARARKTQQTAFSGAKPSEPPTFSQVSVIQPKGSCHASPPDRCIAASLASSNIV